MEIKTIQQKTVQYAPWVLVLFHLIGLLMFLNPNRVENLSGWNMLLCATLVFLSSINWKKEAYLLLIVAFLGILVEVIGVNTGYLFGDYVYGSELGRKLWGVPIVLGLNWYAIVASTTHLVLKWRSGWSLWQQVFSAALLGVGLDYLIEPIAMQYNFWDWNNGVIPLYNYLCWFIFLNLFITVYLLRQKTENPTASTLYLIWLIFFGVLNIVRIL